jgi:hypothetical protein
MKSPITPHILKERVPSGVRKNSIKDSGKAELAIQNIRF